MIFAKILFENGFVDALICIPGLAFILFVLRTVYLYTQGRHDVEP